MAEPSKPETPVKMNPRDFARAIRETYPGRYDQLKDDFALAQAIAESDPVWADKIDFGPQMPSGEEEYAKQHPIASAAQAAAESAPIKAIQSGMSSVVEGIDTGYEKLKDLNPEPVKSALEAISPIEQMFKFKKKAQGLPAALRSASDELLTKPIDKNSELTKTLTGKQSESARIIADSSRRDVGYLLSLAAEAAQLGLDVVPGSVGELGLGAMFEFGPKGARSLAKKVPELPGIKQAVRPFKDADAIRASIEKSLSEKKSEMSAMNDRLVESEANLKYFGERLNPTQDSVEYGNQTKRYIDQHTDAAKAPLAARSKAVQLAGDASPAVSLESLSPQIDKIREDLLGVLKDGKDSTAVGPIDKYLGRMETPKDLGVRFDHKSGQFVAKTAEEAAVRVYPEATLGDLLKDRGRVGKAYTKALERGERGTPQSTALKKLQEVIDQEIDRRTQNSPNLNKEIVNLRNEWNNYYDTFYSKEALEIRGANPSDVVKAILDRPETIDAARKIAPEALEQAIRVKKSEIARKLRNSIDPVRSIGDIFESQPQPGYYERLFSVKDRAELIKYARAAKEHPIEARRTYELADELAASPVSNRREGDRGREGRRQTDRNRGFLADLTTMQRMRGIIPAEALVLSSIIHNVSPKAAAMIAAAGITPSAAAWAYYSVPRAVRSDIISAIRNVSEHGPKAGAREVQILRQINNGQLPEEQKKLTDFFKRRNDLR